MIDTLTYEQMEDMLLQNNVGRIGCNDGDKTYIVPVNYVYDGRCIIAHSLDGLKIEMMRKNPHVCFEVDEIKNSAQWKSVIAWGEFQELVHERERYYAMSLFTDRMIRLKTGRPSVTKPQEHLHEHENLRPVFYRIVLIHKTGRHENE